MQHYSCDFAPVSTLRIRVEQAQICDDVLLVVSGHYGIGGRGIGDIEIKRRLLHRRPRNRFSSTNIAFGLGHIDDRQAVAAQLRRNTRVWRDDHDIELWQRDRLIATRKQSFR
jgi:hypothetical protein